MSAAEAATEVVAEVAEEVAEQATNVAEVSRGLSGHSISIGLGGFLVGVVAGGAAGYIFAQRKLEERYMAIAEEQIAEMKEHYNAKEVARDNEVGKGALETIVRERGYAGDEPSSEPPMAVTPPAAVVEAAEAEQEDGVETPPPAEEEPEPEIRNVFRERAPLEDKWDWAKERAGRTPMRPYVIHRDEREEQDAYDGVTFTYYEADDVVCNERDEVIDAEDRERIFGEENLEKFGHGSGDATVVYVRNNQLEMDIEIVRSPNSYAEEVHGFEPPEIIHADRRQGRKRFDDD